MTFNLFQRSSGIESIFTRTTANPRGGWRGEASTGHDATATLEPAFAEPCFEGMETRLLLDVSPTEFAQIRTLYPDLDLSSSMSAYNVIEVGVASPDNVSSFAFSETGLRAAIAKAGTTAGNDLIVVRTTAPQNTIYLGSELTINFGVSASGTVTIVSLSPIGNEPVPLTIDAQQNSRVFHISNENANVALAGMTITNGFVTGSGSVLGGGILNYGTLTVTNSTITGNTAHTNSDDVNHEANGGGIYSDGTLTVANSIVSGNTISGRIAEGGGIYSEGTLTVTNSTITENTSSAERSGDGICSEGTLTVTDSIITGNSGFGIGGFGTSTVANTTLAGNGNGGIICDGMAAVTNSTITGNGGAGGGIFSWGTLTVTNSIITGNTTIDDIWGGGGIGNYGTLTVINSTIAGNMSDGHGGGIWSGRNSTLTVTNSLIAGNTASGVGGGIYNDGTAAVTNSTIVGNTAVYGGGMYNDRTSTMTNSIVVGNSTDITHNYGTLNGYNSLTTFTGWSNGSGNGNIVYNSSLPLFVDAANGDYQLAVNSQAIDKGNNSRASSAGLTSSSKDLAGNSRIRNGTIDIGAYEYQGAATTPLTAPTGVSATGKNTTTITVGWNAVSNASGYTIQYATDAGFTQNVQTQTVSGGTATSADVTGLTTGTTYYVRVLAAGTGSYSNSNYSSSVNVTLASTVSPSTLTTNAVAVAVTVKGTGFNQFVLTWKAPPAKSVPADLYVARYDVYANGTRVGSVSAGSANMKGIYTFTVNVPFVLEGMLQPKTILSFDVVVVCQTKAGVPVAAEVTSDKSAIVKAKTLAFTAPKAGKAVKGDVGLTSATVRWQAYAGADGYVITWYNAKDKKLTTPLGSETVAAGETSFEITGLSPGTKYTYTIVALNNSLPPEVTSAVLKKSVATLKFTATKKPALVKGSLTSAAANLSWRATALPKTVTAGEVTYELFYTETKGLKPTAAEGWTPIALAGEGEGEGEGGAGVVVAFSSETDAKGRTTITATITGLDAGKTYYIFARSIWSESATAFSNSGVMTLKTPLA